MKQNKTVRKHSHVDAINFSIQYVLEYGTKTYKLLEAYHMQSAKHKAFFM